MEFNINFIGDELLHELFEYTADRWPEQTSVLNAELKSITYRDLDERANRLAHYMLARGLKCEDRVVIILPRSEHVYIAMLAVLKAGAAYVPLDPETPIDRA